MLRNIARLERHRVLAVRALAEQAFSRTAGAPLLSGNAVRILRDAAENYPAWLEAIATAKNHIHFESYIIEDDETGREFLDALTVKAGSGVRVRLVYDWMGGIGKSSAKLFRPLIDAGGEVRCFNPPRISSPFDWLSRDHRKMISVDCETGFVTGLCVSSMWKGDPVHGVDPWRDMGVIVRGPAVADIERAFAQVWDVTGDPIPEAELRDANTIPSAGDIDMRVIATVPNTAGLYRLDQLIAAMARKRLWLTDAYFVGTSLYVQGLRAAAQDGVDVRLLVPGGSDLPLLRPITSAGYRPLLEAGVRVYEWNGPMLHAKTAVADGRWARIGSSNLNLASWIGNYELDVSIEQEAFAQSMEQLYLQDLEQATEIVLTEHNRVRIVRSADKPEARPQRSRVKAGRAAAGVLRITNTVGAAIASHRVLGPAESRVMLNAGILLLVLAGLSILWPRIVAFPIGLIAFWASLSMLFKAWQLRRERSAERKKSGQDKI